MKIRVPFGLYKGVSVSYAIKSKLFHGLLNLAGVLFVSMYDATGVWGVSFPVVKSAKPGHYIRANIERVKGDTDPATTLRIAALAGPKFRWAPYSKPTMD